MTSSQSRVFRIIFVTALLVTLSAPAPGSAGSSGEQQHTTGSQESINPTARNDRAHFPQDYVTPETTGGSSAPVVVRVDGGFDLAAAGIGAAGALGLALVAVGTASALRRRQPGDEARA